MPGPTGKARAVPGSPASQAASSAISPAVAQGVVHVWTCGVRLHTCSCIKTSSVHIYIYILLVYSTVYNNTGWVGQAGPGFVPLHYAVHGTPVELAS